jgi:co-chaperonin GroES (HSP10)
MIYTVGKRILATPLEVKKEPKGSLLLPALKDYITAEVFITGDDVGAEIDRGDIIIIPWNCATEIEINGDKYLSLLEDHVLAVWRQQ